MDKMKNKYGARAEQVFYATANSKNQMPQEDSALKKSMRAVMKLKSKTKPDASR